MSKLLNTKTVRRAYILASLAHKGQVDKGGSPYINHPVHVAESLCSETEQTVALLHDVIEDTPLTLDDLIIFGFSRDVVNAVDCLTKRQDESRSEYLKRVKRSRLATRVKLKDLEHNADLPRLLSHRVTQKDLNRTAQYRLEINFLETGS